MKNERLPDLLIDGFSWLKIYDTFYRDKMPPAEIMEYLEMMGLHQGVKSSGGEFTRRND